MIADSLRLETFEEDEIVGGQREIFGAGPAFVWPLRPAVARSSALSVRGDARTAFAWRLGVLHGTGYGDQHAASFLYLLTTGFWVDVIDGMSKKVLSWDGPQAPAKSAVVGV